MFYPSSPMQRLLLLVLGLVLSLASVRAQTPQPSPSATPAAEMPSAYFAGGCFWCMQYAFDRVKGVKKTIVGYTGGKKASPDYEEVSSGTTGHAESIQVIYDPKEVTYAQLVEAYWRSIDPTAVNRQFADAGTQYRTVIFYRNDEEKKVAEDSKAALGKSGKFDKPIATQIVPLGQFYPAEDYHQDYYKKNSLHFQAYEIGSGRAGYLKRTWGQEDPKP